MVSDIQIVRNALTLIPANLPADAEKTQEDWKAEDAQYDWRQDAFMKYHIVASKYLAQTCGGSQTSRDIHSFCQGFKLAIEAMTKTLP